MALESLASILLLLPILLAHNIVNAQQPVILDITKYGAKPGADIREALLSAWKEACSSTTTTRIVIPDGTWSLSQAILLGANKSPIELEIKGTINADPDFHKLPNKQREWITINYVNYFTLFGGGVLDGHGQQAWAQNDCHIRKCAKIPLNLSFNFINNSIIHDLTSKNSKNWHINCISSRNVTFQRVTISAPGDSPNTDGIHIARSTLINVTDSIIATGDDCISIGDQTTELYITNVTCGPGHGISIGSLGKSVTEKDVNGVYVRNCTFIGTQNGIRVKTWPSAPATIQVSNLVFEDLIMNNVSSPVIIDQEYCPYNKCSKEKPSLIKVSKVKINNIRGTSYTEEAVIFDCSSSKPCEDVEVGDIDLTYTGTRIASITTKCNNIKPPSLTGKQNPPVCANAKFA